MTCTMCIQELLTRSDLPFGRIQRDEGQPFPTKSLRTLPRLHYYCRILLPCLRRSQACRALRIRIDSGPSHHNLNRKATDRLYRLQMLVLMNACGKVHFLLTAPHIPGRTHDRLESQRHSADILLSCHSCLPSKPPVSRVLTLTP